VIFLTILETVVYIYCLFSSQIFNCPYISEMLIFWANKDYKRLFAFRLRGVLI